MKRLLFLYAALIFFACDAPKIKNEQPSNKRKLVLPVQVGKATFLDVIEQVLGIGNIQAEQRVVVTSEVSGKFIGVYFHEGKVVKAGQNLANIDPRDYQLKIKKLEADLAAAKKEFEKATKGLRPEEQEKLRAQNRAAKSALDLSLKERARIKQLVDEKVVSQSDLDIVNDRVRQAQETLSSSQATLTGALRSREEDIAQKDSDREAVLRQLEIAKLALSKTTLRAPFDGIILSKKIEKGTFASLGTPILEMIGSSKLKAVIEIPKTFREKLSKLTTIEFSVKDLGKNFVLSGEALNGVRVIPDANIFSGNISVQVNFFKPDPSLFPGLTLEALFKFEARKNVLHVPSVALVISEKGSVVYSIKNNKAHLIPVKAFKEKNGFTEIQDFTSQISKKTLIILRGASAVFPGVQVIQVNVDPKNKTSLDATQNHGKNKFSKKPKT